MTMTTSSSSTTTATTSTSSHSYFRVYGVPLTILAALFVVSWYTEFFSLTVFGILDDHRKTTTNKPYSVNLSNRGNNNSTPINETTTTTTATTTAAATPLDKANKHVDLELPSASNTNHTVSSSPTTTETHQHVPRNKTSQSQKPSDNNNNSSSSSNDSSASSPNVDSSQTQTTAMTATETTTTTNELLPWPLQVLQEYKQQHSVQALIQDQAHTTIPTTTTTNNNNNSNEQRKFAIVYYYCPHRAGNILHNLFNSITWAMIHNRTILWKYDTDFTTHRNTVEDCQAVLQRAEWIASYDEWAPRLGFVLNQNKNNDDGVAVDDVVDDDNDNDNIIVPIPIDRTRLQYDQQHRVVVYPQIKDVMKEHSHFFRTEWRDDPAHSRNNLLYIRDSNDETAQLRAAKLYEYGVDFLFGMLFREIFTVKVAVENPFDKKQQLRSNHNSHDDVFSLALHSRHTVIGDDGSFIPDEIKCLEQLLPNNAESRTLETCVVYLMSDRPTTIQKLSTWLELHNCTGVSTNNNENNDDTISTTTVLYDEMGPNQGEGFIRELELASAARSGLIGDFHRSSFMLLVELVEYERRMDKWRRNENGDDNNNNNDDENLLRCNLPERYGGGYDYGPGTPTFRAEHHRKPLAPIQVFKEYKSMHSAEILRQETWRLKAQENNNTRKHFVVSYLPCPIDSSIDEIRSFLNDMLLAVVSNRTLLWKYAPVGPESSNTLLSCDRFLQPNDWLPSYEEFSQRLGPSGTGAELNNLSGGMSGMTDVDIHAKSEQVGRFPDHPRGETLNLSSLINLAIPDNNGDVNSSQVEMLYSEGIDFLYGMLLEEAIRFREVVQQPALSHFNNVLALGASFTLGLHVDSVQDIDQAKICLKTALSNATVDRCDIYLSTSDQRLVGELDRLGYCSIRTLTNRGAPEEMTLDDASTANLHFFQDFLYCAKHVRSGFIGKAGSSSSALFVERIEYLRRIEIWKQGRIPRILPKFRTCQA